MNDDFYRFTMGICNNPKIKLMSKEELIKFIDKVILPKFKVSLEEVLYFIYGYLDKPYDEL